MKKTLPLYRRALAGYMRVFRLAFASDRPGEPFGWRIFREEAMARALHDPASRFADGQDNSDPLLPGYKDVTLLFELLRDYLRAATQLSRRYGLQGPDKGPEASRLIEEARLAGWMEGHALLALLDHPSTRAELSPDLERAIAGWRQSYEALGRAGDWLDGESNPLGLPDDLLVITQSVTRGDPRSNFFHTYDYLSGRVESAKESPLLRALARAKRYYDEAKNKQENYLDRRDLLSEQWMSRNESYDAMLRDIAGAGPEDPEYGHPEKNPGGRIADSYTQIELAKNAIESSSQAIDTLKGDIEIEIARRAKEAGINADIGDIHIGHGDKQAGLTEEIGAINANQTFWNGVMSSVGILAAGAATLATGGAGAPLIALAAQAQLINADYQASAESEKASLAAEKERYQAAMNADIQAKHDELLDNDSRARVKAMWLRMTELNLDLTRRGIELRQAVNRLLGLYADKEDVENRKAEFGEDSARRYNADPSHRILADASMIRAAHSFRNAQRWMFILIRAAEYKHNAVFRYEGEDGSVWSESNLFRARNVEELEALFDNLEDWDETQGWGDPSEIKRVRISLRDRLCGQAEKLRECFAEYMQNDDNRLEAGEEDNPLSGYDALRIEFSTIDPPVNGLFREEFWNEKIDYLQLYLFAGDVRIAPDNTVPGYLRYGGVSLVRKRERGSADPTDPDRVIDEFVEYPPRRWTFADGSLRMLSGPVGAAVDLEVYGDPDKVDVERRVHAFKEYSVAASSWILYMAIGRPDQETLVDLGNVSEIELAIGLIANARPDRAQ